MEYRLSHYGEALRFVYTDLTRTNAGNYLITDVDSCGPAFNQAVYEADSLLVPAEGIALNSSFLSKVVANPNKGVILIESSASTAYPLELNVVSNGTVLVSAELPLRTSSVEFMYRWINLRHITLAKEGRSSDISEPINYPDNPVFRQMPEINIKSLFCQNMDWNLITAENIQHEDVVFSRSRF